MGYIKIDRSILNWGWYQDMVTKAVFLHLLLKANYTDGKFRTEIVPRGSLITSSEHLAFELGTTRQVIRTALNKLESTGEITIKSTNKYTLISIVNYARFQDVPDISLTNSPTNEQPTTNQQLTNNQPTTNHNIRNKEYKNIKKERNKELNIIIAPTSNEYELGARYNLPLTSLTSQGEYKYRVIYQDEIDKWQELYPSTKVEEEIRSMCGWCDANLSKRKTERGVNRFINQWLSKAQDKSSGYKKQGGIELF